MNLLYKLKDINIYLVILDLLFLIVSFLFLNKRKVKTRTKDIFVMSYTLINLLLFTYINELFNNIFSLNYISVKVYLITILLSYVIYLITINKKFKSRYKALNYLLFILSTISLFVNIYIILTNKLDILTTINLDYSLNLMNITEIIYLTYLILISVIYIISFIPKKQRKAIKKTTSNTYINNINELATKLNNNKLFINNIDCSIILFDSIPENIVKNYNILVNNIEDKLVNGFTLKENIMLKNICNKLNVTNLKNIDLNNFNILNKIDIDEYNFLINIVNN